MTFLNKYFIKNCLFLLVILGMAVWLFHPLMYAFNNNPWINGVILGTLFLGISLTFYQFYVLKKEQKWYLSFEKGEELFPGVSPPQVLAPLRSLSLTRDLPLTIFNRQSLLNSIDLRLEELHDFNRYLIGLLIFLGLLGTFWGLSQTIGAIAGVVSGIDVGANDIKEAFQSLKAGLQSPLQGMGTAFSSSMFGLASSLILGFMDIQVGKGCKNFYRWMEEKLMAFSQSNLPVSHHGTAYSQALLEQLAENISGLLQVMQNHEDSRLNITKSIHTLTEKLVTLSELMTHSKKELDQLKHNQQQLHEIVKFLTAKGNESHSLETVGHKLNHYHLRLEKLLEEIIHGRQQSTQELRSEIRLIAKTISALAQGEEAS